MANGQWPDQWTSVVTVERLLPTEGSNQEELEADWFFAEGMPPDVYCAPQPIIFY